MTFRNFLSTLFITTILGVNFLCAAGLFVPVVALAVDSDDWSGSAGDGTSGTGGAVEDGTSGTGGAPEFTPVTLNNPLNNIDSLEELIVALLNIFITLMIPVIVFFIIYAGFKYVVAQGNPGKIEEAHQTLLYVIIGGVLILAAVAIAEIIKNTVAAF
jgi:hypothetical protein